MADAQNTESTFCGPETHVLIGNEFPGSEGIWEALNSGSIGDVNEAMTFVDNIENGVNSFTWTLSHGACFNYDTDTVIVYSENGLELLEDFYEINSDEVDLVESNVFDNDFIALDSFAFSVLSEPTFGTLEIDANGDFIYTPFKGAIGIDRITYEVCNELCPDNCEQAELVILLKDNPIECIYPNYISPNGDGHNDVFEIPCLEFYTQSKINIYNRWGDKIFEKENYANDWDGTFNGKPLPASTYFFVLDLGSDSDEKVLGYITVTY